MGPAFKDWVALELNAKHINFTSVQTDASGRKYWRVQTADASYIACISPPSTENNQAFVVLNKALQAANLSVPKIIAYAPENGYFLLSDFGQSLYFPCIKKVDKTKYLNQAVLALIKMQKVVVPKEYNLPKFDPEFIKQELELFTTYFLESLLEISFPKHIEPVWQELVKLISEIFEQQPVVFVHRDYHFCNLFVLSESEDSPGIIDYQDAVWGPVTYDLVSLLRDRYSLIPDDELYSRLAGYYKLYKKHTKLNLPDFISFKRWFDITALQRHLKVVGIFARLHIRDHKSAYLKFIPNFLQYILFFSKQYPKFNSFAKWINSDVIPAFNQEYTRQIIE